MPWNPGHLAYRGCDAGQHGTIREIRDGWQPYLNIPILSLPLFMEKCFLCRVFLCTFVDGITRKVSWNVIPDVRKQWITFWKWCSTYPWHSVTFIHSSVADRLVLWKVVLTNLVSAQCRKMAEECTSLSAFQYWDRLAVWLFVLNQLLRPVCCRDWCFRKDLLLHSRVVRQTVGV